MIPNTKYNIPNTKSGFTLIEMLVVVFVVSIGIVGAISFYNINITNQFEARNELIGANLAQEGTELVRNIVDYERLQGSDWATVIVPSLTGCTRIDYNSLSGTRPCNNGSSNSICFLNGRYQQCPGGTDTGMQRAITISYSSTDKSLTVSSVVTWNGRTTTAHDILYDNSF